MFRSAVSIIITFFLATINLPAYAMPTESGVSGEVHNYQIGQPEEVISNELILPVGGVSKLEPIEGLAEAQVDIAPELRIAAELPDFYKYGSDYGREYLKNYKGETYVECYDELNEQCKRFEGNYKDIIASATTAYDVYNLPKVSGRNYRYSMTKEGIEEVVITLKQDHPEYYWLDAFTFYLQNERFTINLTIKEAFALGSVRRTLDEAIDSNLNKYVKAAEKYQAQGEYMTAKKVHDDIAAAVEYGYDDNGDPSDSSEAHSIVSVLDNDESTMPVCEGYAKSYNLILNALGIDNIYLTGMAITSKGLGYHAWNTIKLDDGKYYWVDLTWDDTNSGILYNYFARGNSSFSKDHSPQPPEDTGFDFQCAMPYIPDADFEVMPLINDKLISGMDIIYSGTYGDNLGWAIYENHVLYINGTGDMPAFTFDYGNQVSTAPWYEYQSDVSFVIVGDGVTSVSDYAFWRCYSIAYAYFPDGVRTLGRCVFGNCFSIKAIRFPASLESIGETLVFSNSSDQFSDIYYGGTETEWETVSKKGTNIPKSVVMHYNYPAQTAKEPCVKITADYDTYGRLISAFIDNTFTEDAGEPVLAGTNKVFIWNSLEGMQPIVKKEQ